MAKISSDFERFLKANFPDEFLRITADGVKDDVVETILRRREDDYRIWCNIPEWIKNEYRDNLPDEVLNGNVSVRQFVQNEEDELKRKEKETKELMDYSVSLIAAGYMASSVNQLVKNREERLALMREAKANPNDKTILEKIIELREKDSKIIAKDWKENQSEKYFMHLARELSRAKKREKRATSPSMKAAAEMKMSSLEREFKGMGDMLEDENFRSKLVEHLRSRQEQAALYRMDKDVFKMLQGMLKDKGIKIEQKEEKTQQRAGLDKASLVYELKQQYEQRTKNLNLEFEHKDDVIAKKIAKRNVAVKNNYAPSMER